MERKSSGISWKVAWGFCVEHKYTVFTILFSVFSSPLDAGFMAGIMGWFAYPVNFVVDVASELLIADFAAIQRRPRLPGGKWTKRQKLGLFMLTFAFLNVFFSWLFSWQTILVQRPDLDPWIAFAAAFWTPLTVMGWGIGEAITKSRGSGSKPNVLPELTKEEVKAWQLGRNGDGTSVADVVKHFGKTHIVVVGERTIRNWIR